MIKYVKNGIGYDIMQDGNKIGTVEKYYGEWLAVAQTVEGRITSMQSTRVGAVNRLLERIQMIDAEQKRIAMIEYNELKEYIESQSEPKKEEVKYHNSEYDYKNQEKTMDDVNGDVARKLYNKFKKDYSLVYRCICRDNGRIIVGFVNKATYEIITELLAQQGIEKDLWFKWDAPLKFEIEGETIYIQEYITETLFDIRESEYYESMSDAYHGVKEDDGRYSIYDVYKDSELL